MDFYFSGDGDLKVNSMGDIALSQEESNWRDDAQQAYIRCMTEVGDFRLYPSLGADLSQLMGMPQSRETGEYGRQLILSAFEREGRFIGRGVNVVAIPVSPQTIEFRVYITNDSAPQQILSVQQDL